MLQKSILIEPKWGGTSSRKGGTAPLAPPLRRHYGYQYKKWYTSGKFCELTVKNSKAILWTRAAKFELKPPKNRLFCRTRENRFDSNLNQVRPACIIACLAARRILYISAAIPHFGYTVNITMLFLTEHQKLDSSKRARQNKKSIIS